jgi:hypothetical protein
MLAQLAQIEKSIDTAQQMILWDMVFEIVTRTIPIRNSPPAVLHLPELLGEHAADG